MNGIKNFFTILFFSTLAMPINVLASDMNPDDPWNTEILHQLNEYFFVFHDDPNEIDAFFNYAWVMSDHLRDNGVLVRRSGSAVGTYVVHDFGLVLAPDASNCFRMESNEDVVDAKVGFPNPYKEKLQAAYEMWKKEPTDPRELTTLEGMGMKLKVKKMTSANKYSYMDSRKAFTDRRYVYYKLVHNVNSLWTFLRNFEIWVDNVSNHQNNEPDEQGMASLKNEIWAQASKLNNFLLGDDLRTKFQLVCLLDLVRSNIEYFKRFSEELAQNSYITSTEEIYDYWDLRTLVDKIKAGLDQHWVEGDFSSPNKRDREENDADKEHPPTKKSRTE